MFSIDILTSLQIGFIELLFQLRFDTGDVESYGNHDVIHDGAIGQIKASTLMLLKRLKCVKSTVWRLFR